MAWVEFIEIGFGIAPPKRARRSDELAGGDTTCKISSVHGVNGTDQYQMN